LSDGPVEDGCVTCPWHDSRFHLEDGDVVRGPATRPQPVYRTRVNDGNIEICREEPRTLRTNPV
jgi:nitrite reductase/ring-hydroxylating ferredoxin subunit